MVALVIETANPNTHKANMIIVSLWLFQNFELWLNYLLMSGKTENHLGATMSLTGRTDSFDFERRRVELGFPSSPLSSHKWKCFAHTRKLTYRDRVITACPT